MMRSKCVTGLVVLSLLVCGGSKTFAADASFGADFVSAYVWRGITVNDGLAAQPYVDVAADNFAVNVWGNYDIDDYGGAVESNEFSEIDLTVSYTLPVDAVDISIGHIEYLFPNGGTGTSEVFVSTWLPLLDNLSMGVTAYYDYGEVDDFYVSAGLAYDMAFDSGLGLGASVSAGYAGEDFTEAYSGVEDGGLHEYTLGLNASYPLPRDLSVSVFIAYSDSIDEDVLPDQDEELFGGAGVFWSF